MDTTSRKHSPMRVGGGLVMAARVFHRVSVHRGTPPVPAVVRGFASQIAVVPRLATAHAHRGWVVSPNHRRLLRRTAALPGASTDGGGTADDPWNKAPIALDAPLYGYLLKHTREPDVLRELRVETSTMRGSNMQVPPEQGAFMKLLVELTGASRVIEVGTYTGYSSIAMAMALPPASRGGKLVACDSSEVSFQVARKYWKLAGVEDIVEERLGDGKTTLEELIEEQKTNPRFNGAPSYDLGFIDADKRGYWHYYNEMVTHLIKKGGLIAIDNVLWYGKVADETVTDKQTNAIREFNQKVFQDERVTHCTIPIGDGLTLLRVR